MSDSDRIADGNHDKFYLAIKTLQNMCFINMSYIDFKSYTYEFDECYVAYNQ